MANQTWPVTAAHTPTLDAAKKHKRLITTVTPRSGGEGGIALASDSLRVIR